MNKFVIRFRIIMIVILVLMSALMVVVIHYPMRMELEKETLNNFELEARLNMQILEQYIDLCVSGTRSLSSRSESINKIVEYNEGKVSWEEMTAYLQPQFMEGLSTVRYLVGATRIIDGKEAVSYGSLDISKSEYSMTLEEEKYVLIHEKHKMNLKVYVPIKDETGKSLGFDVLFFDATQLLLQVDESNYKFAILGDSEVKILTGEVTLLGFSEGKSYNKNGNTIYIREFSSNEQYYYLTTPNDLLYAQVEGLSLRITIVAVIVIVFMVLFSNWYIVKKAEQILEVTEESRIRYKEYAIKDTLTGAYSRRYLEKVRKEWESESLAGVLQTTIVFIDIDDFKGLNDQYGHDAGDAALKYLVNAFEKNIRSDDILIRQGGDEFILILKNCFMHKAVEIMEKVDHTLQQHEGFEHVVNISYGISEITNIEQYDQVMKDTDQKMYDNKKQKKATREKAEDDN